MRSVLGRGLVAAALVAGGWLAAVPPAGEAATGTTFPVPAGGLVIDGHGYGNGIGLSQWGADGAAAVDDLSAAQILDFYYPHTAAETLGTKRPIRVELAASDATGGWCGVSPAPGLTVTSGATSTTLPKRVKSRRVQAWRLLGRGGSLALQDDTSVGWRTARSIAVGTAATFSDSAAELNVQTRAAPAGHHYRGTLTGELASGALLTVNTLGIDDYVRGVVPDEMPSSWPAAALQAQAVAARSYATYQMRHPRSSFWDVHGNTTDEAYGGADTETAATDAAVAATAGQVRVDGDGSVIFAAFGAADGGETVASDVAGRPVDYLVAQPDPYDDAVPNTASAWSTTLTPGAIEAAYPAVGSVRSITVDGRDGNGAWGGRITALTVTGTAGSVQASGWSFAWALGLRSPWWVAEQRPGPARRVMATVRRSGAVAVSWQPPRATGGRQPAKSYRVRVRPGAARVAATGKHAVVRGLPAAPGYAVSVRPISTAGRGPSVTVSTRLQRAGGDDPALTLSRQSVPDQTADGAVLVTAADPADRVAGPVLASAANGPLLPAGAGRLSAPLRSELTRALRPGATVWLLGRFAPRVTRQLSAAGWRCRSLLRRTPAATTAAADDAAVGLRRAAGRPTRRVVEVDGTAPTPAVLAGAAAGAAGAVVLLTAGATIPKATANWLAAHRGIARHRWAVGADAVRADPQAAAVRSARGRPLSVAVAAAVAPESPAAAVVAAGDRTDALAAGAHGEVVLAASSRGRVPAAGLRWLAARGPGLRRVVMVGSLRQLPYSPVAAQVNRALLN